VRGTAGISHQFSDGFFFFFAKNAARNAVFSDSLSGAYQFFPPLDLDRTPLPSRFPQDAVVPSRGARPSLVRSFVGRRSAPAVSSITPLFFFHRLEREYPLFVGDGRLGRILNVTPQSPSRLLFFPFNWPYSSRFLSEAVPLSLPARLSGERPSTPQGVHAPLVWFFSFHQVIIFTHLRAPPRGPHFCRFSYFLIFTRRYLPGVPFFAKTPRSAVGPCSVPGFVSPLVKFASVFCPFNIVGFPSLARDTPKSRAVVLPPPCCFWMLEAFAVG